MIQSGATLIRAETTLWEGSVSRMPAPSSLALGTHWSSYAELYRRQLWVSTVVNKLAMGTARLPLKVYERDDLNRPDASDSPYGRLLAKPSSRLPRFLFWLWVSSTYDVFGEAFLGKIRDPGGRPVELVPLHPTAMTPDEVPAGAEQTWTFQSGRVRVEGIRQSNLVHFRTYNPDTMLRGMSRLEPLRRTLEFEDAAQRAQSSFWRRGARPGVALTHPANLTQPAQDRLKLQWDGLAAGADKTGTSVVLEEGMTPTVLTISNDEAQYIDSRKLNREEVCGVYDVPPPAVHILDRATFSNITEQMRSLYRDTQAPRLKNFEDTLETDLRASVRPGASEPDFGDRFYAEFLLDEVLRGAFEARSQAYKDADWMTMAEKRQLENLPFIEGTDRIFVNAATVPLDAAAYNAASTLVKAGYDPESVLETLDLPPIDHDPANVQQANAPSNEARATLMGRLSRPQTLDDIDPDALTAGISDDLTTTVLAALALSVEAGDTVPEFRARVKSITEGAA